MKKVSWLLWLLPLAPLVPLHGTTAETISRRAEIAARLDDPAQRADAVRDGLNDPDPEVRIAALFHAVEIYSPTEWELHCAALADAPEAGVRMQWLNCSAMLEENSTAIAEIWNYLNRNDPEPEVRKLALQLSWPFFRNNVLLSQNPNWDHVVEEIGSVDLPLKGWRFQTDPEGMLHQNDVWKSDCDDTTWPLIGIGTWEDQGFPGYDGYAWYRLKFVAPECSGTNAVELAFDGVDEEAWVWLNGVYLGAHAAGPDGWNVPFRLDATAEIRRGAENVLAVRVYDRSLAGGIWKPVHLGLMK